MYLFQYVMSVLGRSFVQTIFIGFLWLVDFCFMPLLETFTKMETSSIVGLKFRLMLGLWPLFN